MILKIPKWLAFQTYLFGTKDSKTFISNERIHEYVLLEGLSSDLWKIIADTEDYNKVKKWAKTKGLDSELDSFIEELQAQDLILDENPQTAIRNSASALCCTASLGLEEKARQNYV